MAPDPTRRGRLLTNLKRLLHPRHVCVIGGRDAAAVIRECRRIGYSGPLWAVNPKRDSIEGVDCFNSVDELPEPPDATFVAVPRDAALEVVTSLDTAGAGGVVCYTAGFGEDGSEGGEGDRALVNAAGNLALVGPNCYGLINYLNKVALWPFEHGGFCPGYGAAIITQSGMLSSDITMNQRSLPLAFMVSAGNQSVLTLEDYVDVLCERDEVRAIGLHIEGLKDIQRFCDVAGKCLSLNKPLVVLKSGTSQIGATLTISHTGSLSGSAQHYQALFDKLNVISVDSPSRLLETLKLLCTTARPAGKQLVGFTCSGGGATMVADYAERIGLNLPVFEPSISASLTRLLPSIATVSNPLDYTTPIWGQADKTFAVFESALSDTSKSAADCALLVQDYPLPEIDDSKQFYLNDAGAFAAACKLRSLPAVVCSTLPENLDATTREFLMSEGVAPLQGIHEALDAIESVASYTLGTTQCLSLQPLQLLLDTDNNSGTPVQVSEGEAKHFLMQAGIDIPAGHMATLETVADVAANLDYPLVLKLNSNAIAHKTDIGAVAIGIGSEEDLLKTATRFQRDIIDTTPSLFSAGFLVEQCMPPPLAELVVGIRRDAQFGLVMTLGSGGTLVELIGDTVTMILPVSDDELLGSLHQLKVSQLMSGYRGGTAVDWPRLVGHLQTLFACMIKNKVLTELEINPLFVYPESIVAIDVLMVSTQD